MTYNRGDIVVVKFPFVTREKETQKGRPALVISDPDLTRRSNSYVSKSRPDPHNLFALRACREETE